MYTLQVGSKPGKSKYKTYNGLQRRLELQAETTSEGGKEFAQLRVDTWEGVQWIALTFYKSGDGIAWGWEAHPGIPR